MLHPEVRPWMGIIREEELEVYREAGFGQAAGLGRSPALLVIDTQIRSVGREPAALPASLKDSPAHCGLSGWRALGPIARLLDCFRRRGWPVLHPHVAPKTPADVGRLGGKTPGLLNVDTAGYAFAPQAAPAPGEILLPKKHPSAFFGTALVSHLVELGADTLIIAGGTTSGCVRASVTDAFSYNFRVVVPEDAVFDRCETSHAVNLFDMAQKFADVMTTAALLEQLDAVH